MFFGVGDAYGFKSNLDKDDVRDFGIQHSKVDWSESESNKHVKNWRKKGDVFIHEDYDSDPQHPNVNNIALIKLDKIINFQVNSDNGFYSIPAGEKTEARGSFVRPICLPSPVKKQLIKPTRNFKLVASGYGDGGWRWRILETW